MDILIGDRAEKMISKYVPVSKSVMTKTPIQAIAATNKISYPVVLKLISPKAVHKTEINGIRIVSNHDELRHEYSDLYKTAKTKKIPFEGVLVQEFVKGHELIIGLKNDPTFGPVIVLGMGGKYVEVIKDVTFRVCPIDDSDAKKMINELRYKQILFGVRKEKPANLAALRKALVNISKLGASGQIDELDINPFILNDKEGKAVDARIKLKS
jgi:4-hydroxybutyryl-CoA synthetase (ADP-forming)